MIDPRLQVFLINTAMAVALGLVLFLLTGCESLKNYERSASFSYENPQVPGAKLEYKINRR
jgi:hypothetical protein